MSEQVSRLCLLIESLVCLMPVTLITATYAVMIIPMYVAGLGSEPWAAHIAPVFTVLGLVLQLYGWCVIKVFLVDGRQGIRWIHREWIYAIILGAGLVALSGVQLLLMILDFEPPDFIMPLLVNCIALPALIPFAHVMLEWWWSLGRVEAPSNR